MSQPPFDPTNMYQPEYQQAVPKRPTSVTVLAIIGIILGSLSVLCSPMGLLPYFVQIGPPNPMIDSVKNDPALFGYMIGSIAVGWVIGLLLLVGSIGALLLKDWARKGLLTYAWIQIVLGVIGFIAMITWFNPRMTAAAGSNKAAALGGQIGGMIGAIIGLILPVLILVFMNRPHVKAAFTRSDMPNM